MLESITVKNLALVKESEVELGEGLNILTGETGAGKSIILGSVKLALGGRGSRDIIGRAGDYCLVELTFKTGSKDVINKCEELDIPLDDDRIVITRRISENRSVLKVNGETVSARALKEIASLLINIHGQHDTDILLDSDNYMDILDNYASDRIALIKEDYKSSYKEYKNLLKEYEEAKVDNSNKDKELDFALFEINEIDAARLVVGEDDELEEQYNLMKNANKITEALNAAYNITNGTATSGAGLADIVGAAYKEVSSVEDLGDGIDEIGAVFTEIEDRIADAQKLINEYVDGLDFSKEEFDECEERLSTYNHLKSKYGGSVERVLAYRDERQAYVDRLNDYDAYMSGLKEKLDMSYEAASTKAGSLSKARREAAGELTKELTENLKGLNFNDIALEIKVTSDDSKLTADGIDEVGILVSFNVGEPMRDLSQVASGGELSRFMLALKAVTADKEKIETLVFDEIDTGISGKTAWNVSEKLSVISRGHQVIAITHLPQIAAMADRHYLIDKSVVEDATVTDVRLIAGEDRVHELARMLSGGELNEAGILNARQLIESANSSKM